MALKMGVGDVYVVYMLVTCFEIYEDTMRRLALRFHVDLMFRQL